MKSRELANVLIKMMGFLACLYAIPNFIGTIIFGLSAIGLNDGVSLMHIFSTAIGIGLIAISGIIVIATSHKIAVWMFKNDE